MSSSPFKVLFPLFRKLHLFLELVHLAQIGCTAATGDGSGATAAPGGPLREGGMPTERLMVETFFFSTAPPKKGHMP